MTDDRMSLNSLHRLVWTALLASSIAAGAYLVIPIGPIPVSMQPFFVFLAGYILGPVRGAVAVLLYIAAGAAGLPVFAGGASGAAYELGPTGGYLVGFVGSAWFTGLGKLSRGRVNWGIGLLCGAGALVSAYGFGALWLQHVLNFTWAKTLAAGVIPFIPWDVLKVAAALACARYMKGMQLLPAFAQNK